MNFTCLCQCARSDSISSLLTYRNSSLKTSFPTSFFHEKDEVEDRKLFHLVPRTAKKCFLSTSRSVSTTTEPFPAMIDYPQSRWQREKSFCFFLLAGVPFYIHSFSTGTGLFPPLTVTTTCLSSSCRGPITSLRLSFHNTLQTTKAPAGSWLRAFPCAETAAVAAAVTLLCCPFASTTTSSWIVPRAPFI